MTHRTIVSVPFSADEFQFVSSEAHRAGIPTSRWIRESVQPKPMSFVHGVSGGSTAALVLWLPEAYPSRSTTATPSRWWLNGVEQ